MPYKKESVRTAWAVTDSSDRPDGSRSSNKRNRPLLMGVGGVITAMSCFLVALPHFIYGPGKDALALTKEFWDQEYDNLTASQLKEAVELNTTSALANYATEAGI
uniref:Uncharacterized protein n=1 Tax=Timema douglasi TaxID=61478 RepID=A0A7R8VCJ3_TIMDO|nr:unnamed protein product [Timema douglasi]